MQSGTAVIASAGLSCRSPPPAPPAQRPLSWMRSLACRQPYVFQIRSVYKSHPPKGGRRGGVEMCLRPGHISRKKSWEFDNSHEEHAFRNLDDRRMPTVCLHMDKRINFCSIRCHVRNQPSASVGHVLTSTPHPHLDMCLGQPSMRWKKNDTAQRFLFSGGLSGL